MTTEKHHVKGKLDLANAMGEQLDKQKEAAEFEAQQYIGGESALKEAASKILLLHGHVDKDIEEGKLPGHLDGEILSYIKKKITQAHEACLNLAQLSKSKQLVANGKAAALRPAVEMVQRQAIAAKSRLDQIYAMEKEIEAMHLEQIGKLSQSGDADDEATEDTEKKKPRGRSKPKSKLDARRVTAKKVSTKKKTSVKKKDGGTDAESPKTGSDSTSE